MGGNAEYQRERRARLKALGLCLRCGKRPAEAGKTRCRECADNENQKEHERKKQIRQYCQPGYRCLVCDFPDCKCPMSVFRSQTREERMMIACYVADT